MMFLSRFTAITKAGLLALMTVLALVTTNHALADDNPEAVKFYNQSIPGLATFGTTQIVKASPQTIWSILADNDKYPQWNPFTPEAKTTFEVGTPIEFKVRLFRTLPKLLYPQKETVVRFNVNDSMCWESTIVNAGVFKSFRCISLTVNEEGNTVVNNGMLYGGLLADVVLLFSKGSVNNGFEDLSNALKARAEAFEAE